jgi:O-Antigen ligase
MHVSDRRVRVAIDVTGAGTVSAVVLLALRAGGDGGRLAALVGGVASILLLGRLVTLLHRVIAPLVVLAAGAWVALQPGGDGTGGPLSGPFAYRNATAAFLVQGAVAGFMVAVAFRWETPRIVAAVAGGAAALWLGWLAVQNASTAVLALGVIPLSLFALVGRGGARFGVIACGVALAVVLAGTVGLGATYRPGAESFATRALTERRLVLWSEALDILAEDPGGVGVGGFATAAPTAIRDQDARWAHQEFLEVGVELGWAGLALVVLLFAWGFVRLAMHPRPDAYVALGGAALAALGIHASVDYVWHFPAVPLAAAALVGAAQAAPRRIVDVFDLDREESVEGGRAAARAAAAPASG